MLTTGPLEISIGEPGPLVAGMQHSLVCDVTVEGGTPTAFWEHNGQEVTDGVISSGQEAITVTLEFDPLTYQDGGEYTCVGISTFSDPNTTNASFFVQVQGKQVVIQFLSMTSSNMYISIGI